MKRSIRKRIALHYVQVTGILVAGSFVLLYLVVHRTVYNQLDDNLEAMSLRIHRSLSVQSGRIVISDSSVWRQREHGPAEVIPVFVQISDTNGTTLKKSKNLLDNTLPQVPGITGPEYSSGELSGSPIRQIQSPIRSPRGPALGFLTIAMPRDEAVVVLNNLWKSLLIIYPLVLALLYILGKLIAGRSMAPVGMIITATERISRENIAERVTLPAIKDELYRLAFTINGLLERLQGALLREQQFTADAAHELLTPLASLRGTLEVSIRKPRDAEYYVEKIAYSIQEVNRILNLVDQLLMIARADGGTLRPSIKPIDLSQSVSGALERMDPLIINKHLTVHVSSMEGSWVRADRMMLDIILTNVLSNAIKYSPENKSIDIAVETNGSTTSLSIKDHGQGMSEEEAKSIFQRFYRADKSRTSQVRGSGLGLAIVKRLADLQEMSLSVQSMPSVGTTFTISCPR